MGQSQYKTGDSQKMTEKEAPQESMRSKADFKAATPLANSPKATGTGKRENPGRDC